jgi:hypothetical protein
VAKNEQAWVLYDRDEIILTRVGPVYMAFVAETAKALRAQAVDHFGQSWRALHKAGYRTERSTLTSLPVKGPN